MDFFGSYWKVVSCCCWSDDGSAAFVYAAFLVLLTRSLLGLLVVSGTAIALAAEVMVDAKGSSSCPDSSGRVPSLQRKSQFLWEDKTICGKKDWKGSEMLTLQERNRRLLPIYQQLSAMQYCHNGPLLLEQSKLVKALPGLIGKRWENGFFCAVLQFSYTLIRLHTYKLIFAWEMKQWD